MKDICCKIEWNVPLDTWKFETIIQFSQKSFIFEKESEDCSDRWSEGIRKNALQVS